VKQLNLPVQDFALTLQFVERSRGDNHAAALPSPTQPLFEFASGLRACGAAQINGS
jgi:hypothetical protein